MGTGFSGPDAQADFTRARRRQVLERLATRLRREPSDIDVILPFGEVIDALGHAGARDVGLESIPLDSIVGTTERTADFDRRFRPVTERVRPRWERIARAERRGEPMPPISVYRIGDLHFVRDGHHRVSVARAQGRTHIDGYVREVRTTLAAGRDIRLSDLPLKSHERMFWERVPLPAEGRGRIALRDPGDYSLLAEGVEAWGFRASQARRAFLTREEVARSWFAEEYVPVVEMLGEADLLGPGTETESYMRTTAERWRLMRTHTWSDEAIDSVRRSLR